MSKKKISIINGVEIFAEINEKRTSFYPGQTGMSGNRS